MDGRFKGKTVIVTGGSRGIGFAIAQAFVAEHAQVVIASQNETQGHTAVEALQSSGGQVMFVRTDVSNQQSAEKTVTEVLDRFGTIDVLVNNAGAHEKAPFTEESEALWQRMYRINVLGTVFPSQAVGRHMQQRGQGAIVHVASKAGIVGEPGHVAYSAAKGAVIARSEFQAKCVAPVRKLRSASEVFAGVWGF